MKPTPWPALGYLATAVAALVLLLLVAYEVATTWR